MSLDNGIEEGLATAGMPPSQFAPTSQQQLEWPKWGEYMETKGKSGEPPDLPAAVELKRLYGSWLSAENAADQATIWHNMLKIYADEVFSIGTVAGVLQPVVVNDRLRNVPEHGIYNWDPGSHFGIYKPDGFWFDTQGGASASLAAPGR